MLTKRFELFSLLGFRVSLDLTWIILALLITWSLATGYFPQVIDGLDASTAWWLGLAGALGLFGSIILHEFAHAWIARQFDLPIRGITLFIFGGVAEMEEEPANARAEFFMAIAGPIMSYFLAAVFFGLAALSQGDLPSALFGYLWMINAVLATFNLLPAFPLDGGRVFRAAFWWWTDDYRRATRVAAGLGRLFGTALIILGVLNFVSGATVAGVWQALIGLFIIAAASSSETRMAFQTGLEGTTVGRIMVRDPISIPAETALNDVIDDFFYRYHHRVFPVVQDGRLLGAIRIEDVGRVPETERPTRTVADVVTSDRPSERPIAVVPSHTPALDALKTMQSQTSSRLLVADDGTLKGVLTMRDILNHLAIRQELGPEQAKKPPAHLSHG